MLMSAEVHTPDCYSFIAKVMSFHEIHRVPKKTCDYISYNNFNNKCPIIIIFGIVISKSMRHRKMVSFPTSPLSSATTLPWEITEHKK